MVPRWSRRGPALIPVGDSGSSGATRTFAVDRSYSKTWRVMKPTFHTALNPTNWSVAFQTAVLIILSACMLVYSLLSSVDSGGAWPEERKTIPLSADLANSAYGSAHVGKHNYLSRESLGPAQQEVSGELDKESDAIMNVNATASTNHHSHFTAASKISGREHLKLQLRRLEEKNLEVYSDPTARFYPLPSVCRVFNGCLDIDGTMVLPDNLKSSKAMLRACGMLKVRFENELPVRNDGNDFFTNVLRYHMPHLVTDTLSLSYAMSVVRGDYMLETQVPHRSKEIRPVAVGQDRIRSMSPGAWTLEMLARLPYNTQVKTKKELFSSSSPSSILKTTCFRSIITFDPQIYWQVNPSRFLRENALFSQNNLWSRGPRKRRSTESSCTPVVAVLNRPPDDQRTLSNVHEIEKNFEQLRTTPEFTEVVGASFRVEYMNSSFKNQMKTIQDADVILASHGAALANLLFSRVETAVIEVFPFSEFSSSFSATFFCLSLHRSMPIF